MKVKQRVCHGFHLNISKEIELLKENSLIHRELQNTNGAEDDFDDAYNKKRKTNHYAL